MAANDPIDWFSTTNPRIMNNSTLQFNPSSLSSNNGWGDFFNRDNLGLAMGGLQGLGSILGAFGAMGQNKIMKKNLKLARDQFNFQRDLANRNYANELSAFNTAMEDRINARASQEDKDQQYIDDYLAKHQLRG